MTKCQPGAWRAAGPEKDVPYIMDFTFSKYDFEKKGEQITGYSISEINKKEIKY